MVEECQYCHALLFVTHNVHHNVSQAFLITVEHCILTSVITQKSIGNIVCSNSLYIHSIRLVIGVWQAWRIVERLSVHKPAAASATVAHTAAVSGRSRVTNVSHPERAIGVLSTTEEVHRSSVDHQYRGSRSPMSMCPRQHFRATVDRRVSRDWSLRTIYHRRFSVFLCKYMEEGLVPLVVACIVSPFKHKHIQRCAFPLTAEQRVFMQNYCATVDCINNYDYLCYIVHLDANFLWQ